VHKPFLLAVAQALVASQRLWPLQGRPAPLQQQSHDMTLIKLKLNKRPEYVLFGFFFQTFARASNFLQEY